MTKRPLPIILVLTLAAFSAGCIVTPSTSPTAVLAEWHATPFHGHTVAAWRHFLQPTEEELAWRRIPWLSTFGDGLTEARQARRPLLLWVMNGHPLGAT